MKFRIFLYLTFLIYPFFLFAEVEQNPSSKNDSINERKLKPAVVAPFGDSLFVIYEKVGPFTPDVRAKAISERLQGLEHEIIFTSDSFSIEESDFSSDILYNDLPIMSVTDADAQHENMNRRELAEIRMAQIKNATILYKEEFSWSTIIKKVLLLFALLAFITLLIFGVNRLFRWFYELIRLKVSPLLQGMKLGKARFTDVEKTSALLISIVKWIKLLVILIVIYVSLPLIIYLIPSSKSFTDKLLEYTLDPLIHFFKKFLDFIPNLFTIAIIVIIFNLFIRLFKFLSDEITRGAIEISGFYKDWALPTFSILRFILYAFMFIVIFPYLPGSSSPIFQGVSVFLGLLVSLGSAGSISNIIAGIVITYMRSFDLGDRVRVGDVEGDVVEKSMLVTRIRTIKNEEITVPNGTLMSGNVMNFSKMARESKTHHLYIDNDWLRCSMA
jgi:hypothetical protein